MEESLIQEEVNKVQKRKDKIASWFHDPHNQILFGILLFAAIIRIYFFIITKDQAVWWDSADYLSFTKKIVGIIDFNYFFTPRRTFLLPLIWAGLLKIGFGELSFRVIEVLFSISGVLAMYLMGKEMFNKKIGLISAFLMSVFWMHLFYSNKLMTEIPSLTFLTLSIYFFWKAYSKKNEKSYVWFGLCLGLAFLARAGTLVMFAVFPVFLIMTQRFSFLKNKRLWHGALVIFLLMGAFFISVSIIYKINAFVYFLALSPDVLISGDVETEVTGIPTRFEDIMGLAGIKEYINFMPHYFGSVLLIVFALSFLIFISGLVLRFDLIIKRKESDYDSNLFILIFALVPFLFQSLLYHGAEDRYLMNAFPAFFIIISLGLISIENYLKKYQKEFALILILVVLAIGGYHNLNYANTIIKGKTSSYLEVKQAGLWIKENSNKNDIVFSASVPQNTYYSERKTYNFLANHINESYFETYLYKYKPKYFVLSIYEPQAQWTYAYPATHNNTFIPVKAYDQNGATTLVIYQVLYPQGNQSSNPFSAL